MAKFDTTRNDIMNSIQNFLESKTREVLRTGSQEFCIPIVNEHGDEGYMKITFSIPKGSRDGEEYDGYAMAEEYKLKCEENARKAKERAEKKAKKIEADKKRREKEGN